MVTSAKNDETNCPYCGSISRHLFSTPDLNRHVSKLVFDLFRCTACDLLHVTNPPDDLESYYTADYHPLPTDRRELEPFLAIHRFKIDLLKKFRKAGDLLEIGASAGQFCALAQDAGFNVSAIEMDQRCAGYLSDHLKVRTTNSDDPRAVLAEQDDSYDVICFWHSLEHLPEPWRVLEQAAKRLRPGGIISVAAPNPIGRQARMMGKAWPHHDLPRHLFGLSIPWLKTWGQKHGLKNVLATTRDSGSVKLSRSSWGMMFSNLAPFASLENLFWKFGLAVSLLFAPWEDKEGEGCAYVMVFEKPDPI